MPRPKHARKDLSAGWHQLHRLWRDPLEKKITYSRALICRALEERSSQVVCWSGGKDSTVVLHLVRKYRKRIPVIFIETGVDFPETIQFVKEVAAKWRLDLHASRPSPDVSFWQLGREYGWPILGKGVASNVERARRSQNHRKQLSQLERRLVEHEVHISCKCSEILQVRASRPIEQSLNADAKFIGLRAGESRARVRLWVDHGDYYHVKRYYGRGRGIWKVNPIATWTEDDIWRYHKRFRLPICDLYSAGYPRNGCWPCAMAMRNGQLKRLRQHHPKLFSELVLDSPMGSELIRVAVLLRGGEPKQRYRASEIRRILEDDPCILDCQ
jgi:3'-phosphoadenosine 5'-phosphosulfate sulfotransferase (PAPS reductase)/FAD synthetase